MFIKCTLSLLLLAVLPCSLYGQQRRAQPTGARTGAPPASTPDPLAELQRAQAQAIAAGDPAAIASATQPYLVELLRRLAVVRLAEGSQQKAVEFYANALAVQDSAALRLDFAALLLRLGNAERAIDILKPATAGELAGDPGAWTLQAMAERAAGNDAGAASSFERALALHPDVNIAYALGAERLMLHQEDKAQQIFRGIFQATGNNAVWHVGVGDAYREARYFDQAVEQFKQAIALDPRALHAEFFLGLTYLQMNEWGPNSQSFEHLRKAIALSPHEYVSNFYLGALESTDGSDLASSDRHLETAAAADPSQPEVWLYLGLNANREHRIDVAERDLRKCIDLTGSNEARNNYQVRRAYFALGRLLITKGQRDEGTALLARYKQAELAAVAASGAKIAAMGPAPASDVPATLSAPSPGAVPAAVPLQMPSTAPRLAQTEASQLHEQDGTLQRLLADAYNDLGTAQARQQQYLPALASFQQAEKFGNPSPALLRNIGAAAFRVEDFAEAGRALRLYFAALRQNSAAASPDQRAQLMLGFAEFHNGHFGEAAAAFAQAPEATLADDRAAYSWAFSLARTGRAQEANALAGQLAARPLPSGIRALVCHLYVDDEDYEDSLACYRKAYQQDSSLRLAHYEAGQALIHLDRAQEALDELAAERKLTPDDPNVTYAYAYALLQVSRKDEAQSLLTQLAQLHPEQPQAQYQLGKLLLDQGRLSEAIAHLEASEKADPAPDYVHYQLATAYRKANRSDDAEREFAAFRDIKSRKRAASATATP